MKKIGIIGGLSHESTAEYYLRIMRKSNCLLGSASFLEAVIVSINPSEIIAAVYNNAWQKASHILTTAAKQLELLGANLILIPCNTLHKVINDVQKNISIPIINIIDCVGNYMNVNNFSNVALLGTQFTMTDPFYRTHLYERYNVNVVIPKEPFRELVHNIIFNELCRGRFKTTSKHFVRLLCEHLYKRNAEAVILACTELPLLIKPSDVPIRLIDTIDLHTDYAVNYALNIKDCNQNLCKVA